MGSEMCIRDRLNAQSNNLIVGRSATFSCSSDLAPTRIRWYRGRSLVSSTYGAQGTVTHSRISTDDEGEVYTCKITSSYGSQERNVTLHVIGIIEKQLNIE